DPDRAAADRPPGQLPPAGWPAGRRRRGGRVPRLAAGRGRQRADPARVRAEPRGQVMSAASPAATPDARVERLDAMPSLPRLYSRALARSASLVLASRRPAGGAVPDVAYVVEGVRADPASLAAYEELLGEP